MQKHTEKKSLLKIITNCIPLILVVMLLIGAIPINSASALTALTGEALTEDSETSNINSLLDGTGGQNITSELSFDNAKLEILKGSAWVEIDINDLDYVFSNGTGNYKFSINWETSESDTQFDAGDFFTFKLPVTFANQTIIMTGPGGANWGTIVVDTSGNGKATFNENIEGLQEIKGSIAFSGTFVENSKGKPVEWVFGFDAEYVYHGISEGIGETDTVKNQVDLTKGVTYVSNSDGDSYHRWNITLNPKQKTEGFTGKVEITDTFGGGYKMIPAGVVSPTSIVPQPINADKGYHGALNTESDTNAYFYIEEIDWNGMREYYNTHLVGTTLLNGTYAAASIPEGVYTNYFSTHLMWERYVLADRTAGRIPPGKDVGDYKYINPYTGRVTATLTSDGFAMEFPDGMLEGKCLRVFYWTELSAMLTPDKIKNHVEVKTSDKDYPEDASITIASSSKVTGTTGYLTLFKQDSNEQKTFPGVEFTLTKNESTYTRTLATDSSGKLNFELSAPYGGVYTLTENAQTTPEGYDCADSITLVLDSTGKITSVNGTPVSGSSGLTLSDVCKIDKDGLIMVVYNKRIPMGGIKITKIDSEDNEKTLPGAEFRLYYTENNEKYYYPASGKVWTSVLEDAKVFKTDELGEILITSLMYRTYYLEEIKAPARYEIETNTTEITINSETVKNITVKNKLLTTGFTVQKADADEWESYDHPVQLLDDAEFILYYTDEETIYYYNSTASNSWVTDKAQAETLITVNGRFQVSGLPYDKMYTLEETGVPEGYDDSQVGLIVYITISTSGNITVSEPLDSNISQYSYYINKGGENFITVTNTKKPSIDFTFRKVDAENNEKWLPDAKFILYACNNISNGHVHSQYVTDNPDCCWTKISSQISDENGLVTFEDLYSGEYMLVETQAPDGYQLPSGQWQIKIDATEGIKSIIGVGRTFAVLTKKNGQGDIIEYLLLNEKIYQLPLTGGTGQIWMWNIVGVGLIGVGILLMILFRKRKLNLIEK